MTPNALGRTFSSAGIRARRADSFFLLRWALLAGVAMLCSFSAGAAVVTSAWSNATSGLWTVNANWTITPPPNLYPNNGNGGIATFDAVINATGSAYTVTLNSNITIEKFLLNSANATLDHTAGTFTANGGMTISAGTYELDGGTISNSVINESGTGKLLLTSSGGNLLTGVTVNGDLTANVSGGRTMIAGGTTFTTAHLAAVGAGLGFAPGQTLTGTILFEGAVGGSRNVELNGTAGAFTIGATGVIRSETGLTGSGQIGGSYNYGGLMALTNNGLISSQVSGNLLTIQPNTFTNGGTVQATGGGILTIAPATTWTNAGTISLDATSTVNLGGTFNTTGGIGTFSNAAGGTVNVVGTVNNTGNTLTLNTATGSWTLAGGTLSGGTLAFANSKTLLLASNNGNLLTGVTVNGDLTANVSGGRTMIAGGTTFTTAHLAAVGAGLGFAPGQTLTGTILFEGAAGGSRNVELNGTAGAFTIGATGVIRSETGLTGSGQIGGSYNYGGLMALTNNGLISSQVSGNLLTIQPNTFTNGGTVQATGGGILTIAPATTWTNAGTISLDATSTVNLGGTFNTTGGIGTFSNAAGGTVNVVGTVNNTGNTLTLNTATGSWTLAGGTLSGGTLAFANSKTLLLASNNGNLLTGVTVNGDLTANVSGGRTMIAGGTTFTTAHLAAVGAGLGFAPGQTLTGTILFEGAAGGSRNVEMNGTAGAFTIGATGVIRSETGLTGSGQIGGSYNYGGLMALTNNGLISSQVSGNLLTIQPNTFTNGGTVQATGGGILTIAPATTWTNAGTISLDATSTVNLGGTFNTTGGIGTFSNAAGGTVNVVGTVNNTGNTLTLNTATGSWTLAGGTLSGGTLAFANSKTLLLASNNGNLLTGVTVNGDLTANVSGGRTIIAGGTTFTTAHLAAVGAGLGFAPGQTLTGTILFEGAAGGSRNVELNGTAGAFTIGATGVIRSETGLTGSGQIGGSYNYGGLMALTNNGLISSQVSGNLLTIQPNTFSNGGTVQATGGGILTIAPATTWTNAGTISLDATSTVNLGGTFNTTGGIGTFSNAAGGTVNVVGTVNNTGNTLTLNTATGSWTLAGGTLSGGTLAFANSKTLLLASNNGNLLTGVTVNGDLTANVSGGRTMIAGGTTFTTAHLAAVGAGLGFAPGQTLTGTILFEGAAGGSRNVELNGTAGAFTIGATGVIRSETGLTGSGQIGGSYNYGGLMALTNNGLISSQVSGNTLTIQPNTFTNGGTVQATGGGILNVASTTTLGNYTAATQTLTGGTWVVNSSGTTSTLQLNRSANILVNAAEIDLTGAASTFLAGTTSATLESTLTTNNGTLRVLGGRNFSNTSALTNAGLLALGGGTFNAPSLANSVLAATLTGFGTVTPRPTNSGAIIANGGTLTFTGGIGGSGAGNSVTINAAATLDLSAGANSTADYLAHNGTTLALGTKTFTVGRDYTNTAFGSGNSFNARADVTGAGPINAAGTTAQAILAGTGFNGVTGGTTATPTLTLGNIHVGSSATLNYRIANTGGTGSADLRGALQGTVNGGNLTDARLSGTGVTASNFGALAPGTDSGDKAITFTGTTAGAVTGQKINVTNNFDNVADQLISLIGAAFRYAAPSGHTPEPISLGNRHVGDTAPSQLLTLTNSAAADGFSEALNASIAPATGGVTASGSFSLLGAGATNSNSLAVSYSTATAGDQSGTATISLTSDGTGTSGLGTTTLTSQTVNVTGAVFRLAAPSAHTPEPVAFGIIHVGDAAPTQALTLTNSAAADGYSESLNASIGSGTSGVMTNSGSFTALAPGATNNTSLSVSISATTRGNKNGTATISLASNGAGSSGLGITALTSQTVSVTGQVNEFAQPILIFKSGSATLTMNSATHFTLDFGTRQQNSGPFTVTFGVQNSLLDATYQDSLGGSFNTTAANDFTLGGFVVFSGVAPGSEIDPTVTFSTTKSTGSYTDTVFLNPTSSNASGTTNQNPIEMDILGQIVPVPEPGTLALLLGAAPLLAQRRRRSLKSTLRG